MKKTPILLLLMLSSLGLHAAEVLKLDEVQRRALGVEIQAVADGSGTASSALAGRVEVPLAQLRVLAAPVAGVIEQVAVAPGMTVKRGQLLATLRSAQILEVQRDALQASSQAALQQQGLARDEQLFAEGLIAESRLQMTRAGASQAKAQADERSRGLALFGAAAGQLNGEMQLRSPIDGVVLEQSAQLGQRIEAGTPVYRIGRLSPLWIEAQVPLTMAATLRPGSAARLVAQGIEGKVIAVGRAIDPASQSVSVRVEIVAGSEQLTPGQMVEVELAAGAGQGVVIPAAAVIRQAGQPRVFVQDAAGALAARPVNLLGEGGGTVRVSGLQAGEKIVVRGASSLKGMMNGEAQ